VEAARSHPTSTPGPRRNVRPDEHRIREGITAGRRPRRFPRPS
jgi:hypothetical protein